MDHPWAARRAARAGTVLPVLVAVLTACGGGQSTEDEQSRDSPDFEASELRKAQLVEFEDATIVPEQSEQGTYEELESTQQAQKLREATELDKPECVDAANPWGSLPGVRTSASSLATFVQDQETITHTLIGAAPETAAKALEEAEPPDSCGSYTATMEGGETASYEVSDLDMETVGEDSHAFVVRTEAEGEEVLLYNMVYHNGSYLAATSVLGTDKESDYEETLAAFTDAAVEREEKILS
ncbi:hypothetical protein FHX37_3559 [Haloactinospora alba]|uniref:PknH-like protein n=1 Tax=Haloactinospora alba TaxID=405555 RepID=A0A543NP60_9ACTN|nr:hypothetical protein [Haloactinospora alba]TQN33537.1 hypothetical protein FHX37_3559 [Haloactinospora alba]